MTATQEMTTTSNDSRGTSGDDPRCTRSERIDIGYLAWLIVHANGAAKPIMHRERSDPDDESVLNHARRLFEHAKAARETTQSRGRRPNRDKGKTLVASFTSTFTKPHGETGRLNAAKGLSLQNTAKLVRHAISGQCYRDFDMVNCHPVLLEQYCRRHDIRCANLTYLVRQRDRFIAAILEANPGYTRDDIKVIVLAILNGGSSGLDRLPVLTQRLHKFAQEVRRIVRTVNELNPDVSEMAASKKAEKGSSFNLKGAAMCIVLQDLENRCLTAMERAVCDFTGDPDAMKRCVPIHDGMQVPTDMAETPDQVDALCKAMMERVRRDTGYTVSITEKPMTDHLPILGSQPKDAAKLEALEQVAYSNLQTDLDAIPPASPAACFPDPVLHNHRYTPADALEAVGRTSPTTQQTLCVCAPLGTGKSHQLLAALETLPQDVGIVMVSFRRTFSSEMASRFESLGMDDYRAKSGPIAFHRLLIQVESLHRIDASRPPGRFVLVLDESESIAGQFSAPTNGKDLYKCMAIFEALMHTAETVVCLDGFLGRRTQRMLDVYRPDVPHQVHLNTWTPTAREAPTDIHYPDKNVWSQAVLEAAADAAENPIVVYANSKKTLDALYADIQRLHPHLRVRLYTSDPESPIGDLSDVNRAWSEAQVVMYTPTISAGVSFDRARFTKSFGYFTPRSCDYTTAAQMMSRVRHYATRENHLHVVPSTGHEPETPSEIDTAMRHQAAIAGLDSNPGTVLHYTFDTSGGADHGWTKRFHRDPYYRLHLSNLQHAAKSRNAFFDRFVALRKSQGALCRASHRAPNDDTQDVKTSLAERAVEVSDAYCAKVADAEPITEPKAEELNNATRPLTAEEYYALHRYKLHTTYAAPYAYVDRDFVKRYNASAPRRAWKVNQALRYAARGDPKDPLYHRVDNLCGAFADVMRNAPSTEACHTRPLAVRARYATDLLDCLMGYAYSQSVVFPRAGDTVARDGLVDRLGDALQALVPNKEASTTLKVLFGFRTPLLPIPDTYKKRLGRANTILASGLGITIARPSSKRWSRYLVISHDKNFTQADDGSYRPIYYKEDKPYPIPLPWTERPTTTRTLKTPPCVDGETPNPMTMAKGDSDNEE